MDGRPKYQSQCIENYRIMTDRQKEALIILEHSTYDNPMRSSEFAQKFWPDHLMHVQVTNTGNGACHGKKAWLCDGSYLAKLIKMGWVIRYTKHEFGGFKITSKGIIELEKELQR